MMVVAFLLLLLLGIPYAFALGLASVVLALSGEYPTSMIVHRTVMGVDNFLLVAIPMFILAGNVMERGDISRRLVTLAGALMSRFRAGLPNSIVVAEMLFSGISGSTVADIAAMSSMVVPAMEKAGFRRSYSLAIASAATAFGILIPPCILMIVTAALLNASVIAVFAASVLPTFVFAFLVMALVYWQAPRLGNDRAASSATDLWKAVKDAAWAAGLPLIIIVGIRFGAATATEIAAAAVVYAFAVTLFVYRTLRWGEIPELLVETAATTGAICLTFGFATIITYVLARADVPQKISDLATSVFTSPATLMLAFAMVFVVLGALLEGLPAALILVPILWPAADSLGVSSIHFQIVVIAAIGIGLFLPPIGLGLMIASQVGQERVERIMREQMRGLAPQALERAEPEVAEAERPRQRERPGAGTDDREIGRDAGAERRVEGAVVVARIDGQHRRRPAVFA